MAIFPFIELEETDGIETELITDRGINFLFDFDVNDFVLKDGKFVEVTGDASVVFWIEKTLRTAFEKAAVYQNTEYGTELSELVGQVLAPDVASTISESSIKSALLQHQRIASIENFKFSQENDVVTIEFAVNLNPVNFDAELGASSEDGFNRISTLEQIKEFIGIKLLTSNGFYFKTSLGTQVYLS